MSEADELAMIDGFLTTLVDEDTATLRTYKRNDTHPGMGGKLLARHGIEFAEAEILEVESAALIGEGEDGSRERSSPFRAGDC